MHDIFLNQINVRWVVVAARLIFALLVFAIYFKNRDKLSFYFSLFFLFFGIEGILRNFAMATGINHLYFADLIFFGISSLMVLQGVEEVWDDWLKRYYVVYAFGIGFVLLSAYNAYFASGLPMGISDPIPLFLFYAVRSSIFFLAAYYLNFIGAKDPHPGDTFIIGGLVLSGITSLGAVPLFNANLTTLVIYASLLSCALIGIGWLVRFYKR